MEAFIPCEYQKDNTQKLIQLLRRSTFSQATRCSPSGTHTQCREHSRPFSGLGLILLLPLLRADLLSVSYRPGACFSIPACIRAPCFLDLGNQDSQGLGTATMVKATSGQQEAARDISTDSNDETCRADRHVKKIYPQVYKRKRTRKPSKGARRVRVKNGKVSL